jgi:hypothetical protein
MNTETEIKLWERIVLPTVGDPVAEREAIKLYHDTLRTLREVTRALSSPVATTRARFVSALEGEARPSVSRETSNEGDDA